MLTQAQEEKGQDHKAPNADRKIQQLESKTEKELMSELENVFISAEARQKLPDPAQIEACLAALNEKDPMEAPFDPAYSCQELIKGIVREEKKNSRARFVLPRKSIHVVAAITVVLVFFFGGSYAMGAEWPKTFIRWGGEILQMGPEQSGQMIFDVPQDGYASLDEALRAYGLSGVAPKWIPEDYKVTSIEVKKLASEIKFSALYEAAGDTLIKVNIFYYPSGESPVINAEITPEIKEIYTVKGIDYTIASNEANNIVLWIDNQCMGIITSQLKVSGLKQMIDSIAEKEEADR